jgi:glycosyltransferase involved in cell wall biosynthesis
VIGKWFSNDFAEAVRHLRTEFELEEMVELTGQLTGDAKWDAYFGADVFFFPSHYESEATPIVLMEALGAGLPLISTEWAGIPAMLDGCPTARLLPVRSPEAYADALIEFASSPDSADATSRTSRKFYEEKFLPIRFIERVEKAFRSAAGEPETCSVGVSPSPDAAAEQLPTVIDRRYSADGDSLPPPSHPAPMAGEPVFQSPAARCFGEPARETRDSMGDSGSGIGDRGSVADHTATVIDRRYISDDVPSASTVIDRRYNADSSSPSSSQRFSVSASQHLHLSVYLADQNPGHDRSFGISRMSQVVLRALNASGNLRIETVVSKTSQQSPGGVGIQKTLPWGTRGKGIRLLTDHLHPLFHKGESLPDIHYFPKGYLPLLHLFCRPSVVTIHDTIIQYDEDHYPKWRKPWEYAYWSWLLRHTLGHADRIMTVSESSKRQIQGFMQRHGIPPKEIAVTYEPCAYEELPQPEAPSKENHVIHLASREPHKRSAHLIRWWHEAEDLGINLPTLHLIGTVPPEVEDLLASTRTIVKRPFLNDTALQAAYRQARALILPSEIEGFGLPALEAYYLGTPVCYVKGTSVEEVLAVTTTKGGFVLEDMESLFAALDEVLAMPPEEVRECGLKLRETYAAAKVVERMLSVFHEVKN